MCDEWVEYLAGTNMKIILLTDIKMAALANYYKQNEKRVSEVLYLSEGLSMTLINFRKLFIGLPFFRRYGRTLTKNEKDILYLTLKNRGVFDISTQMSLDVKSVYNIKQRVESKIGMKIRRFF
ncbi:transcriptional regulator, luxR family [Klebsiella oxytoca]|nr:transcriptional regulator, luxR family [Klebsiella oxytoca]